MTNEQANDARRVGARASRMRWAFCLGGLVLASCASGCGSPDDSERSMLGVMPGPNAGASGQGGSGGSLVPQAGAPARDPDAVCGDGTLSAGEWCDPSASCPTSCDDGQACTIDSLAGSAATCDARCVSTPITQCVAGDGCCPSACGPGADGDCQPVCGNGIVDPSEACDPPGSCPTSCDDGDACTVDTLTGSASDCTARCEYAPTTNCAANHARGARVDMVTIDQGVRIDLVEAGAAIGRDARESEIIAHRPALMRAFWALDSAWQRRELRAVLTLRYADGNEEALESTALVDAQTLDYDNDEAGQINGFYWYLSIAQVSPGVEYAIELFEVDDSHDSEPMPAVAPRFPVDGLADLGCDATYMKMRIVLVPIDHDLGQNCPEPPDLHAIAFDDKTEAQYIGERLYALNPVDEVEVVVHDIVPFTGSARGSSGVLSLLQQLREEDDADPGWYYYGMIRPCDGGPGFLGVAWLGSPDRSSASERVGWGVYSDQGGHADTVVHEVGHQQGRLHVYCAGNEAGTDRDYPNGNGATEVWGWDVLSDDNSIYDPQRTDYMSYCGRNWVSRYGWNWVHPRIATISGWELERNTEPMQPLLYVMVDPDSGQQAWIGRGYAPLQAGASRHRVRLYEGHRTLADLPAEHRLVPESESAFQLVVALPEGHEQMTAADWTDGTTVRALDLGTMRRVR